MIQDNLAKITFTPDEVAALDGALATIEQVLEKKMVSLTPKQRRQYSRVRYNMENWVNKATGYIANNAELTPSFVDVGQLRLDMETHLMLNPRIDKMEVLLQGIKDTNLLLGSDIYNACISFYRSVKLASLGNTPSASAIYDDLKKQFSGGRKKAAEK
ncbi:hypothetical protein [uncultured Acetobacteroides sp.]|uniref:hypothetical protein n=1 Tax=uncultured Acetobacteroides sp. TaxID=1760811 RepID=UPI0029F55B05|nr:hypothetical protein [uncultured Acetobacteroides sp.]